MSRKSEPMKVRIVRYKTADGKPCRKGDPGAVRHVEESRTYYAYLKIPGKKRKKRVSLKTDDLRLACERLDRKEEELHQRELGIRQNHEPDLERTFEEHLDDWIAVLKDAGTGTSRRAYLRAHMKRLRKAAGWANIADIDSDSALAALARVMQEDDLGPSTRNQYARHLAQFCRWLSKGKKRRLPENPLEDDLASLPEETDVRRRRRIPTDEEVGKIFAYLADPDCPERRGMTARCRALAYSVGIATGFRRKEIRSLAPESFDLDADPPTVTLDATIDKRRRRVVQPIPAWLANELRDWFASGGSCWQTTDRDALGSVWKADLEACGVPYVVEGPDGKEWCDLHSLRHAYVTRLAEQPGISIKTLMTLARHSSPRYSLQIYAKVRLADVKAAVDAIPAPPKAAKRKANDG